MSRSGKVRIISGQWRGRKLDVLDLIGLRPTPDRMRETLFNWLQRYIIGARCLDLFSGTGALGFEALSRGASEVIMIESDSALVAQLRLHAERLKSKYHVIQQADGLNWLTQQKKGFDIIFLDPPFGQDYIKKSCDLILKQAVLNKSGFVYIEAEDNLKISADWKIRKQTKAGNVNSMLISQR